jgi:lipid-A-disaccharide synthase
MIIAGEASGDLHGAALVREALARDPSLQFFGMGGVRMREAGVHTLVDAADMAVVGLVEVVAHFGTIARAFRTLTRALREERPELLILIDYPDFNLLLARAAKKAGVKVLYFISPQVWAWRSGRVKTIAERVDHMAVVFPFEVPFYERAGLPVTFVGHPLSDLVRPTMSRQEAESLFGLDPRRKVVGLFPGSRRSEIRRLLPVIIAAAKKLKRREPAVQFILPLASSLSRADIDPYLVGSGLGITVISGKGYDVMQVCDAIVTASGTVTLEIALMGVPMVIIYKVSFLTYQIGKRLVEVEHGGLCNIVAGDRIVQELIQKDCTPVAIADELQRLLNDGEYAAEMRGKLAQVREKLGAPGAAGRVAELALAMMKG